MRARRVTTDQARDDKAKRKRRRALILKQIYQWHWISSGICLVGMILFAFTGITLNHAGSIEARPAVRMQTGQLPRDLLAELQQAPASSKQPVPLRIRRWLSGEMRVDVTGREAEWSAQELYIALPRPGGDAWMSIDRSNGAISFEVTDRGWIAYLNDLHKGRHTGSAWGWFLDLFSLAAIVFSLTGLLLLQLHSRSRPATWPIVGLGLMIPLFLLVFLVHF